jgi:hypothetical protein
VSYCCVAVCLAHRRDVYINIAGRAWVHSDGWPCDGMTAAPISAGDLE